MPEFNYNAKYYDDVGHSWSTVSTPIIRKLTQKAIHTSKVSTGTRILDLGCGNGDYGKFLSRFGTVYGLDFSPDAIESADGNYHGIINGSAEHIPLQTQSFDIIFSSEMLEHILDWQQVIKEIKRILKPGGLLIMTTTLYATSINLLFLQRPPFTVLLPNVGIYLLGYISPHLRNRFIMQWAFEPLGGHYHGFFKRELCSCFKKEQYTVHSASGFYAYPPVFLAQGANIKNFWNRSPKKIWIKCMLLPLVTALSLFNIVCRQLGLFANNIFLVAEKKST